MNGSTLCNNLSALIFDLDDTLYLQADYKRSGFQAVAEWLYEHRKIDQHQSLEILNRILAERGPSYPYMFNDFVEQIPSTKSLIQDMIAVFIAHKPQINCFPGVRELLSRLRGRYRLGLLTDGRLSSQKNKVDALKISSFFDEILYSDSLGLSKPNIELYRWFEQKFEIQDHSLAYIGDNPQKDFIGANQRHWLTIRVQTGEFSHYPTAGKFNAEIELSNLTDLKEYLQIDNYIEKVKIL